MSEHASPYEPLHGPNDVAAVDPMSLEVEIAAARRILDETASLNIHIHTDMVGAAIALDIRLRRVVAAFDKERGGEGA